MATQRLYHTDPYQVAFTARVLDCTQRPSGWEVQLDRTCFYAEAGGQPSDSGTLNGLPVLSVRETEEGTILHTVGSQLTGDVSGLVDWERRLDHMEQHTGQHLLSAACERLFDAETVSWHLGTESCTVDLGIESVSREQIEQIEAECNRVIRSGVLVKTHLADRESVTRFPLRKPPKVETDIRVVEIDGYDWSACAGTHVRSVSELGLLKVKSWEKNKKATRFEFLAGRRALADYMRMDRITRELCRSLSIGLVDLPRFVERTQEDMAHLRKQVKALQEKILEAEAAEMVAVSRRTGGARLVRMVFGGRSLEELKVLAAKVAAHPQTVAIFGTKGALPQILIYRSADLRLDVGSVVKQVMPVIDGRGGGSPVQAQGGGTRPDNLEAALDLAAQLIATALS